MANIKYNTPMSLAFVEYNHLAMYTPPGVPPSHRTLPPSLSFTLRDEPLQPLLRKPSLPAPRVFSGAKTPLNLLRRIADYRPMPGVIKYLSEVRETFPLKLQ
ncbi:hypothetical protein FRX31_032663 [Thalictrum thalictroides]|uniref:Uncharacterized protein n=1 Tax=Thalictrum thalictroides TaxID=46969 RepID=A0A7J6UYM1_THATH|nr:hypothetical protein FRX31_032663 [Thalictrum thalictroides]